MLPSVFGDADDARRRVAAALASWSRLFCCGLGDDVFLSLQKCH